MADSLSTEQFQKLNPIEFALARPDAVIGSVVPAVTMLPIPTITSSLVIHGVSISAGMLKCLVMRCDVPSNPSG